jgi:hypothetical protein
MVEQVVLVVAVLAHTLAVLLLVGQVQRGKEMLVVMA